VYLDNQAFYQDDTNYSFDWWEIVHVILMLHKINQVPNIPVFMVMPYSHSTDATY
jgi:hypothetical protein